MTEATDESFRALVLAFDSRGEAPYQPDATQICRDATCWPI